MVASGGTTYILSLVISRCICISKVNLQVHLPSCISMATATLPKVPLIVCSHISMIASLWWHLLAIGSVQNEWSLSSQGSEYVLFLPVICWMCHKWSFMRHWSIKDVITVHTSSMHAICDYTCVTTSCLSLKSVPTNGSVVYRWWYLGIRFLNISLKLSKILSLWCNVK